MVGLGGRDPSRVVDGVGAKATTTTTTTATAEGSKTTSKTATTSSKTASASGAAAGTPEALKAREQEDVDPPARGDRPAHAGATDLSRTVPSKPHEAAVAGHVTLGAGDDEATFAVEAEKKQRETVKDERSIA